MCAFAAAKCDYICCTLGVIVWYVSCMIQDYLMYVFCEVVHALLEPSVTSDVFTVFI